jgi:hypothetical protein
MMSKKRPAKLELQPGRMENKAECVPLCKLAPQSSQSEREGLRARWPTEFNDGARCAFLRCFDGEREHGGYPVGFHRWTLDQRNAWFAGFNLGFHDRLRHDAERAHG